METLGHTELSYQMTPSYWVTSGSACMYLLWARGWAVIFASSCSVARQEACWVLFWSGHSVHTFTSRQSAYIESWLRILPWMAAMLKSSLWMWLDLESPRRHMVVWFPGLTEEGRHTIDPGDSIPLAGSLNKKEERRRSDEHQHSSPCFLIGPGVSSFLQLQLQLQATPAILLPATRVGCILWTTRQNQSFCRFPLARYLVMATRQVPKTRVVEFSSENCFYQLRCPKLILI